VGPRAALPLEGLVSHDPFRIAHRPAAAVYDPATLAMALVPPTPKPILVLTGIAWDRVTPSAIVEGLPGTDGPRVVHTGEAVNGLVIKSIARYWVTVSGMDTVWTLTVREPWR
jgi:hypothetical protein